MMFRHALEQLRRLTPSQRKTFFACYLGWALDAFDFFIMVFVIDAMAKEFRVRVEDVSLAIVLTLAFRPVGAIVFGFLAERFGRKPALMINVLCYSLLTLMVAAAPSLTVLLILRALYGIAMGGEWGIGAAMALESTPRESRGLLSGILQQGYAVGYLLASVAFAVVFPLLGWRALFVIGALPALLVAFLRRHLEESTAWEPGHWSPGAVLVAIRQNWIVFLHAVLLMTAFNFLSHGCQDLYPTFLEVNRHLSPHAVGTIAVIYSLGALVGGVVFGVLSERLGRRRSIIVAVLLVIPIIPLWAFSTHVALLTLGAFLLMLVLQGAWGVVPVHLNELSPATVRAIFPGLAYQLGSLFSSINSTLQARVAHAHGDDYGFALASVAFIAAIAVVVLTAIGPEAKGVVFNAAGTAAPLPEPASSA